MGTGPIPVGVREFREDLARYLESSKPLAITRHGRTIGLYIPLRQKPDEKALQELREANAQVQRLMEEAGITEDEVVAEFNALRKASHASHP
jgi:hypothetical protein